ncbi:MAG: hypothetical protein GXP38_12590 [Chloroflexi bacterium]|nr:hypothetical protein [Chloroflexota bacterium]
MSRWQGLLIFSGGIMGAALLLAVAAYLDVSYRYRQDIVAPDEIEEPAVALVLGAGIYPSGQLSIVLKDRMLTAIELYEQGKSTHLLLSGDNRFIDYNEPARMAEFARSRGVPEEAIVYDYAGRRTYDSCYRARHIFGQKRVIVVTQAFHLPRALYLCQSVGIEAVGVVADRRPYTYAAWFGFREALARMRAWFDVHILHPAVVGGEPIDIPSGR